MKARRAPTHMAMAEMSEDRGEDALRVTVVEVAKQIGIDLKEKQLEALLTFCLGNDVFVSLPTGYGKSMIYGLLPLIFDEIKGTTLLCLSCSFISLKIGSNGSIVICISPLVDHSFPPWPYALVHAALSSKRHSHLLNSINDILCGTQRQSTIYKICRSAEQVVSAKFTRPFPRGGAYNL